MSAKYVIGEYANYYLGKCGSGNCWRQILWVLLGWADVIGFTLSSFVDKMAVYNHLQKIWGNCAS